LQEKVNQSDQSSLKDRYEPLEKQYKDRLLALIPTNLKSMLRLPPKFSILSRKTDRKDSDIRTQIQEYFFLTRVTATGLKSHLDREEEIPNSAVT
jgi:hypothetical protein